MTTIPIDPNFAAHLDATGKRPLRHIDRILHAVNMPELMTADGYAEFMRIDLLRLRLLASVQQAYAMIGCLREGPPTGEQRSDLASSVEQLGQSVAVLADLLHGPISLSVAYRKRLAEYSLRINYVLTRDIPNLNMKRNIAARNFYVSRAEAVLTRRRQALQSLMGNVAVRPLTDFANRCAIAMTEPKAAYSADDAVQKVSEAYVRTRGELAFDDFVTRNIVPKLVAWLSSMRLRHDSAALWSVSADRNVLMRVSDLLNQADADIRYALVFERTNPGFSFDLIMSAAECLVRAARLL